MPLSSSRRDTFLLVDFLALGWVFMYADRDILAP